MSIRKFHEFRPILHLICVEFQHEKNVRFYLGDLFNTEGNLILSAVDQINFSHRTCQVVRTLYSLTLKSYLAVKKSEEFTIGSFTEKEQSEN